MWRDDWRVGARRTAVTRGRGRAIAVTVAVGWEGASGAILIGGVAVADGVGVML